LSGSPIDDPGAELFSRIVSHLSKSRRALAEFLSKASRCAVENNILTFVYDQNEKLGFQHVSEESARRYIERAVNELVQKEVRVRFVVEQTKNEQDKKLEQLRTSPDVSRVLDIFKGEIVPDNDHGGV
jgi:nitrate/nitrite-specific signal transduction histidine kinase